MFFDEHFSFQTWQLALTQLVSFVHRVHFDSRHMSLRPLASRSLPVGCCGIRAPAAASTKLTWQLGISWNEELFVQSMAWVKSVECNQIRYHDSR